MTSHFSALLRGAALVGAAALALTACSSTSSGSANGQSGDTVQTDRQTLVVGDVGGWLEGHMKTAGLLDDLSYDVKFNDLAGASVYATLSAGKIDLGVWGFDANGAKTMAGGSDARIIGLIGPKEGSDLNQGNINLFVSKESGITSIDDLAGKTIGVNWGQGTTADVVLHAALAQAGLTTDDLTVKYFTDSSGATAFLSRQLDGYITSVNGALVQDIQNNGTQQIYFANEASTVAYVIASRQAVIDDPVKRDAVADFVTRVTKYYDWRGEPQNLDAFTQAVATQQSAELDVARVVATSIATTVQVLPFTDDTVVRYQKDLDNLHTWGLLDESVGADSLIDKSFSDAIDAARE